MNAHSTWTESIATAFVIAYILRVRNRVRGKRDAKR